MQTKLIVGCGYLGSYIGRLWLKEGHRVCAVTRSPERVSALCAEGFDVILADVLNPDSLNTLPTGHTLLYSVGPTGQRDVSRRKLYRDGLAHVLDRIGTRFEQIALISSTGVYGNAGDSWIDERAPRKPERESSQALAAAEDLLFESTWRDRAFVFRLGGIYGPNRIPLISHLLQGRPLPTSPDAFLNLIHVEDAATAIDLVLNQEKRSRVVNVVDGHPVMRRDFYSELARLLNVPPPQFVLPPDSDGKEEDTPSFRHRASATKRVSNAVLVKQFGMVFRYPDYRAGLADIVKKGFDL